MVYTSKMAIKQRFICKLGQVIRARVLATGESHWNIPVMAAVSGFEIKAIQWMFDTSARDIAGPFLYHRPSGIVYYEPCDIKPGPKFEVLERENG